MQNLLDIDYLKQHIIDDESQRAPLVGSPLQPYYHGLGCIRLCMKDQSFVNFYSSKYIPTIAKFVHTHRENFISESIYGSYNNILYDVKPESDGKYIEEWVQCWTDGGNFTIHDNVEIYEMHTFKLNEGEKMLHLYNDYHDLELLTDHVVTKVTFDFSPPYPLDYRMQIYPKIVRPRDSEFIGAANDYGSAEDNWEIIREILNEL